MTSSSPRFTALFFLLAAAASASLPAKTARAEAGPSCELARFEPAPGSNIPGNLPALVYIAPAGANLADADLKMVDGNGEVPFTVEGVGPRYVLRPGRQLSIGVVRLSHTHPCGPNRFRMDESWAVGPPVAIPTALGRISAGPARPGGGGLALIPVGVFPEMAVFPFLGTTRFTVLAKRAGSVVGRLSDRTALAGGMSLGEVAVPCAGAPDSGDVEIEVQAQVAGLPESASAGLVARATVALVCPVTKEPNPDADGCSFGGDPGVDADGCSSGGDAGPDAGVRDAATSTEPRVVPPPAAADAAAATDAAPTSKSSGCTVAAAGDLPWWSALVALAAVLRLRRARRR